MRHGICMGDYLKEYEHARYTLYEKGLKWVENFLAIALPTGAEEFADVSFWQAQMDWVEYRKHARAAVIKIGQGSWVDSEFEYNYREAKANAIALGGYWFYDSHYSPQVQANTLINAMNGKSFEMEIFLDWEVNYGGGYFGLNYVVQFMKLVEAAGIKCKAVGIYTGYYFFVENSNPTTNAAEYTYLAERPLWLAWYAAASVVKVPPPWKDWTHWQDGTPTLQWGQPTKEIDHDYFNGDALAFEARYLGGTTPPTGGTMATGTVTAFAGLNVRDAADPAGAKLGALPYLSVVTVNYQVTGTDGNVWYNIDGFGLTGFVLGLYLSVTGDVPPPPAPPTTDTKTVITVTQDANGNTTGVNVDGVDWGKA